jgi:hypothetical protein
MKTLKTFEATLEDGRVVRVMAEDAYKARDLIRSLYGNRSCPYLPKIVPH